MRPHNLTGQRFGRLEVLSRWANDKFGKMRWLCRCDCGSAATPSGARLLKGETKSCGCLHDERCKERAWKHGGKGTQVYSVWAAAKGRCHNPTDHAYKNYGGRGIIMCDAWRSSYAQFLEDMGPRPHGTTLDRRDNNGPYSPENCRWATRHQQMRNLRKTQRFAHNGEALTIAEWAERTGLSGSALYYRIKISGWPIERALTTPSVVGGNKPSALIR